MCVLGFKLLEIFVFMHQHGFGFLNVVQTRWECSGTNALDTAHRFGDAAADDVIHTTEGFFTFGLAFALLLAEAWLLRTFWPKSWRRTGPREARA